MGFSIAQLETLRDRLRAAARQSRMSDSEVLRGTGFENPCTEDPLLAQAVASLAAELHHPRSEETRELARGALILVLRNDVSPRSSDSEADELDAQQTAALVEHALALIHNESGNDATGRLDEASRGNALSLFDRCCDRDARNDDELLKATTHFLHSAARLTDGILFSRMLDDLAFLSRVLLDAARDPEEKRQARGALTYFVERNDAIDDSLGLAGRLDDAFVARFAAELIDTERTARNNAVDDLLKRWPFLHQLRLTLGTTPWTPSSSILLTLAACVAKDDPRTAIVVPRTAELPLLLGVLVTLGRIFEQTRETRPFRPERGTYVAPAGRPDEVCRVVDYEIVGGQERVVLAHLPKGTASELRWKKLVSVLDRYVPAKAPTRRRRITLDDDKRRVELGPLERLFGMDHPIQGLDYSDRVIVIAQRGYSEKIISEVMLHGRSLGNLLPWGSVDESGAQHLSSTSARSALLLIARNTAHAIAAVEQSSTRNHVIAPLDMPDRDESAIERMLDRETRTTAVLPQHAFDMQDYVARRSFRFVDWTQELVTVVDRSTDELKARTSHPFAKWEDRTAADLAARPEIVEVPSPEIDSAWASLQALWNAVRSDYGTDVPPSLSEWTKGAADQFFRLDKLPVLVTSPTIDSRAAAERLRSSFVHEGAAWLDATRRSAGMLLERLDDAWQALSLANAKGDRLKALIAREPASVISCSDVSWSSLQLAGLQPRQRGALNGEDHERPVLRFEWPGKQRFSKLALPPAGTPAIFVFHSWAARLATRVLAERHARLHSHWAAPRRWQALRSFRPLAPASAPAHESRTLEAAGSLEEWLGEVRRQTLAHTLRGRGKDEESTLAQLFEFAGNRCGFFAPDHRLLVVPCDLDCFGPGIAEVEERSARALSPGDRVVLIEGSDRDILRERADRRLPKGARELAQTWHRALLRAKTALGSEDALCEALVNGGCTVTHQTIRLWFRASWQIGPMNMDSVDVIARVTEDDELRRSLAQCRDAITLVRSEHLKVSQEIARQVVDRLRRELALGRASGDCIQLDEQASLLTIERVSPELTRIPLSRVNRVESYA